MNRSTFCEIKYKIGLFFSKVRYMIGVGFKILVHTPVPKLPQSYPQEAYPIFLESRGNQGNKDREKHWIYYMIVYND